ncbi:MAG: hypothetical protein IIC04_04485 [Proteobacteria bacterium]|nr:hypothetical protein [Pseudomonadota bacterium]
MNSFSHVENGIIDEGPKTLPRSWRNISGLHHQDAAGLKTLGWLPVRYENEAYDPATQVRTGPMGANVGDAVSPDADEVVGTYTVRDKSAQEIDDEKTAAIQAELGRKFIKALVKWMAPLLGKTVTEARDEIKAIYKGLP